VQNLRPRLTWKTHVEDYNIVFFSHGASFTLVAVGDEIDTPALFLEASLYELPDGRIVFNDEDFHFSPIVRINAKGGHDVRPFNTNIRARSASTKPNQLPGSCVHEPR
jgi:hypothetical protein